MEIQTQNQSITTQGQQQLVFTRKFIQAIGEGNTMEVASLSRQVGMKEAVQGMVMKTIAKAIGEKNLIVALSSMIQGTASFLNIGNNITENQSIETAFLLIEKYPTESLEDFILLFKNIKLGKYGELYNRFDGQIIFAYMEKHLEAKAQFRENNHHQIKATVPNENLQAMILEETELGPTRPIIDALKEAVGFQDMKKSEEDYEKFKKEFLIKKLKENKPQ